MLPMTGWGDDGNKLCKGGKGFSGDFIVSTLYVTNDWMGVRMEINPAKGARDSVGTLRQKSA